jgi:hypothetical protein
MRIRERTSRSHANATVFAPTMTSSTTLAAPTIVAPLLTCPSVIPRGLVHAPHSQTWPPLPGEPEVGHSEVRAPRVVNR